MHRRTELSFVDVFLWVSPLHYKNRVAECCYSFVHVASRAVVFTLLLRRRVAFLHRTATCRPLFKPSVSLLSTYRQSRCVSNFYRTFKVFIWLSLIWTLLYTRMLRHEFRYLFHYISVHPVFSGFRVEGLGSRFLWNVIKLVAYCRVSPANKTALTYFESFELHCCRNVRDWK